MIRIIDSTGRVAKEYPCALEEFRHVVRNFDNCNESFNYEWNTVQLLQIDRALMASGWDIYPDNWSETQLNDAMVGIAPDFDRDTEKPRYPGKPFTVDKP